MKLLNQKQHCLQEINVCFFAPYGFLFVYKTIFRYFALWKLTIGHSENWTRLFVILMDLCVSQYCNKCLIELSIIWQMTIDDLRASAKWFKLPCSFSLFLYCCYWLLALPQLECHNNYQCMYARTAGTHTHTHLRTYITVVCDNEHLLRPPTPSREKRQKRQK